MPRRSAAASLAMLRGAPVSRRARIVCPSTTTSTARRLLDSASSGTSGGAAPPSPAPLDSYSCAASQH
eukprot:4353519-Pyramimonas_sp.AAC.1